MHKTIKRWAYYGWSHVLGPLFFSAPQKPCTAHKGETKIERNNIQDNHRLEVQSPILVRTVVYKTELLLRRSKECWTRHPASNYVHVMWSKAQRRDWAARPALIVPWEKKRGAGKKKTTIVLETAYFIVSCLMTYPMTVACVAVLYRYIFFVTTKCTHYVSSIVSLFKVLRLPVSCQPSFCNCAKLLTNCNTDKINCSS